MSLRDEQRVVISGLGLLCGLGFGKDEVGERLATGKCAITLIESFDPSCYDCRYASEVKGYRPEDHFQEAEILIYNRCTQFALLAAREALADARLDLGTIEDRHQIGLAMGSSHCALDMTHQYYRIVLGKEDTAIDDAFLFRALHSSTLRAMSYEFGINGPFSMVSTACASGTNALGIGMNWLRSGRVKYVLAGASDIFDLSLHAGFWGLKAISPAPCSPFSGTAGISLGEGATFYVLETLQSAKERNIKPRAELLGYGLSGDAYHATAPDPQGLGILLAIERALENAGISPEQVDYVNAHGTGTNANDETESRVHAKLFGERAADVPISSSKGYFGHATGAAGALEIASTLLCMDRGLIPATLNFTVPRYKFPLDYVPNEPRKKHVDFFLKNSFGFGGNNAAIVVGRVEAAGKARRSEKPPEEVVITGIGLVSPVGIGYKEFCDGLRTGKQTVKRIERFDTSPYMSQYACMLDDFSAARYDRRIDDRRMDRISRFSSVAAALCLDDAGFSKKRRDVKNVGIIMCVSSAPRHGVDEHFRHILLEGPAHPSSVHFPYSTQNSALGQVALSLGLQGFTTNLHMDGCTGMNGMAYAYEAIRAGQASQLLVGGGDEVFWTYYHALSLMKELAARDRANVPFASDADGYHPGEGAIFFLVESASSAAQRGATIYARMTGYGMSIDSDYCIGNQISEANLSRAVEEAMKMASISAAQIGQIACTERGIADIRSAEAATLRKHWNGQMDQVALINTTPLTGWMDSVSPLFNLAAILHNWRAKEIYPRYDTGKTLPEFAPSFRVATPNPGREHGLCMGVGRYGFNYALTFCSSNQN
ncbi:MAG: beta-ketoacyl-[acyl-carrier-protein] synthase family protein [Phycisphaerae bacterium]|nr:beta-ketoacyl-[acyl-carrier-protein] synthase family protein [Phycisphaerae bacterium]